MKKLLVLTIVTILSTANAAAQEESSWTLNTRAWSTNYFASSLESIAKELLLSFAFEDDNSDAKKWADRIIPSTDLVFPIGFQKKGHTIVLSAILSSTLATMPLVLTHRISLMW